MGGGLDILIVGIVGKQLERSREEIMRGDRITYDDLSSIAPVEKLKELFDNFPDADLWAKCFRRLETNPETSYPIIVYFSDEFGCGAALGTGLGYVLFSGNNGGDPKKLDERIFARIPELIARFKGQLDLYSLDYSKYDVGLYAINVFDT